jgi:hypothetical protein
MSKPLEAKIQELYESTKDLMSFEEMQPYCDEFNNWLKENTDYSQASLGTVLSRAGLYKSFKQITCLAPDKNAVLITKHNPDGTVKGQELKHYVLTQCGLNVEQWTERNSTRRVIDRLEAQEKTGYSGTEINPNTYLDVTGELLMSEDRYELAVGLIAATGRRPHEIIARAQFSAIEGKEYSVLFGGQGKKRGEKPVFEIATLYPASLIIKSLKRLRKDENNRGLLSEIKANFPDSITKQNLEVDKRCNAILNRVVRKYFGDRDEVNPVLNFRFSEKQDNCKALRAAYCVLATKRDCKGSNAAKLLFAAKILGHYIPENKTDKDLTRLATTLGYNDYYTDMDVEFAVLPEKTKVSSSKINSTDVERIKQIQKELDLSTQASVVSHVIDFYENGSKQIREYANKQDLLIQENKKLQQEIQDMKTKIISEDNINDIDGLDPRIEKMVELKIHQILGTNLSQLNPSTTISSKPSVIETDFESFSNQELWNSKQKGAANEKIRRCFFAICEHNDKAVSNNDRIAITNQVLRQLSRTNGQAVGDWIRNHTDEIISHNSKYDMQNAKDHTRVETYYNKRHKNGVKEILEEINNRFLDGAAIEIGADSE